MDPCIAALRALPQYRFDGDIRSYLTKIFLRIAVAARRRASARWRQHEAIEQDIKSHLLLAETLRWSTEDIDLIRRVVETLSTSQSEALLLRIVCGFSINEIAEMTGVSQNTVKTRLRLGKNALRVKAVRTSLWSRLFSRGVKRPSFRPAPDSEEDR